MSTTLLRSTSCVCILSLAGLVQFCHGQTGTIRWIDFDSAGLAGAWQARGNVKIWRDDVEGIDTSDGPGGKRLMIDSGEGAIAITDPARHPLPERITDCESMSLWVQNLAEDGQPLVFEVLLLESDRRAAFWRKVEVTGSDWQKVSIALPWMRWADGRVPRWNALQQFAIRMRRPSRFAVDEIAFHDAEKESRSVYSADQLASLAFGESPDIRSRQSDRFWILTNAPALDLDRLANRFEEVLSMMRRDEVIGESGEPARLVVFQKEAEYRDFVARFGKQLGAVAPVPSTDGYHIQGIALSSWNDALDTLRPVYTHEFCHSALSHFAGIDSSRSDWWQEGVANHYQLHFHPQENFRDIVRKGIRSADMRLPLKDLCNGTAVPIDRYWQAATIVGMLVGNEKYRSRVPKLADAFRAAGSTDLAPHIEAVLGITWDQLEIDWLEWCNQL